MLVRACSKIFDASFGSYISLQVARVLEVLFERYPELRFNDPDLQRIARFFVRHKLISKKLYESEYSKHDRASDVEVGLERTSVSEDEEDREFSLADDLKCILPRFQPLQTTIVFAAISFPRRSFRINSYDLYDRLYCFREYIVFLGRCGDPVGAIEKCLAKLEASERLQERSAVLSLLSDIAGVRPGAYSNADQDCSLRDRINGAALLLGTFTTGMLATAIQYWETQSRNVRLIRDLFITPPSHISREEELLKTASKEQLRDIVKLEMSAKSAAFSFWPEHLQTEKRLADAWEGIWSGTDKGFPNYLFQSSVATWLRKEVMYYRFEDTIELDERILAESDATGLRDIRINDARFLMTPDALRFYREGYRLVRSTFSIGDGSDPNILRMALDKLYRLNIEGALMGNLVSKQTNKELIVSLIRQHKSIGARQLTSCYRRLRMRMWCYELARKQRCSIQKIRNASQPEKHQADGPRTKPLEKESLIPDIATLSKTAYEHDTLLGAFVSYLALRPSIYRRFENERWSTAEIMKELTCWF